MFEEAGPLVTKHIVPAREQIAFMCSRTDVGSPSIPFPLM